jgi:hypothetical protein
VERQRQRGPHALRDGTESALRLYWEGCETTTHDVTVQVTDIAGNPAADTVQEFVLRTPDTDAVRSAVAR